MTRNQLRGDISRNDYWRERAAFPETEFEDGRDYLSALMANCSTDEWPDKVDKPEQQPNEPSDAHRRNVYRPVNEVNYNKCGHSKRVKPVNLHKWERGVNGMRYVPLAKEAP